MHKHADNLRLIRNGINALLNLAGDDADDDEDSIKDHLLAILCVTKFMMKFTTDNVIQIAGCDFLRNIAVYDWARCFANINGAMHCVVQAMNNHHDDVPLLNEACSAIINICLDNDNKILFDACGGIPCIVNALDKISRTEDSANAVTDAIRALYNLCLHEETCKKVIEVEGFRENILKVFITRSNNVTLMNNMCKLISLLAANDITTRKLLANASEVLAVLKTSLDSFGTNAEFVSSACQAISKLAPSMPNKKEVKHISEAMIRHASDATVQCNACQALANLGNENDGRTEIAKSGTVKRILDAMSTHLKDVSVQVSACGALEKLFFAQNTNTLRAGKSVIQHILSAMIEHTYVLSVQQSACAALRQLSFKNYLLIIELDGRPQLELAKDHFKGSAKIVEDVNAAIELLDKDKKQAIDAAGLTKE